MRSDACLAHHCATMSKRGMMSAKNCNVLEVEDESLVVARQSEVAMNKCRETSTNQKLLLKYDVL